MDEKLSLNGLLKNKNILIILTGILLLVIALPTTGSKKNSDAEVSDGFYSYSADDFSDYELFMERRLSETLSGVKGVGKTKVMITYKDEETKEVTGVVVIAEGGGNAEVQNNIIKAVQTLFDVPVHKIQVLKMT